MNSNGSGPRGIFSDTAGERPLPQRDVEPLVTFHQIQWDKRAIAMGDTNLFRRTRMSAFRRASKRVQSHPRDLRARLGLAGSAFLKPW